MQAAAATNIVPWSHFEQLREARQVLQTEAHALQELSQRLDARFCEAVDVLASCRGAIIVTGVGKAGAVGQKIAATLMSTGARAYFLHPTEAIHGDLGCVGPQDVAIFLSNSGETDEVNRLLPWFRQADIPIVALTATPHSTLGQHADVVLELGRLSEAGVHGLAPSTSTTVMLALGDALAFALCRMRHFTPQQFATLHPGGSLGRRLTPVRDVMRRGNQLRIAQETTTVREVFVSSSQQGRRTGAVMLVDETGQLTGLFTDSDLARLLEQRREAQLDRPILEVMTERPLTIDADALLGEAVALLGHKHVSELPVVDADGKPQGLIDITDVIGLLPQPSR